MENSASEKAVEALRAGKLIIYPTDTIYGLGCDATNETAVEKVYALKKRPRDMPLSVLVSDFEMLQKYADVSTEQMKLLEEKLPGPFTFILKPKKDLPVSDGNVGFRMIKNRLVNQIVKKFGRPVTATSANIHGEPAGTTIKELKAVFGTYIKLYISGGKLAGRPSKVIDLVNNKTIRF